MGVSEMSRDPSGAGAGCHGQKRRNSHEAWRGGAGRDRTGQAKGRPVMRLRGIRQSRNVEERHGKRGGSGGFEV